MLNGGVFGELGGSVAKGVGAGDGTPNDLYQQDRTDRLKQTNDALVKVIITLDQLAENAVAAAKATGVVEPKHPAGTARPDTTARGRDLRAAGTRC